MSSNELHITRANYEAYFLLYVDGELTPAQCDAVEAFAALHPDLQEELDLLLTTRLDSEMVSFDKTFLMADSMKQNVIDESLLLYMDDELKGEEKKKVEEKITNDATYQYQHNLLLQTKLPAEAIVYPNKAELYRKEKRTIRPVIWYRAAAAVFVLMAAGYMWHMSQNAVTPVTAQQSTPIKSVAIPSTTDVAAAGQVITPEVAKQRNNDRTDKDSDKSLAAGYSAPAITPQSTTRNPGGDMRIDIPVTPNTYIAEPIAAINDPQQIINNQAVTTTQPTAYNNNKDYIASNPGHDEAMDLEPNNHKRGSVKGFLRKATRFIERRTGVATTNQDDELLIGAVAIKLK